MCLLFFETDRHQPFCTKPFCNQSQYLTELVLMWERSLPTGEKYKVVYVCVENVQWEYTYVCPRGPWERDKQSRVADVSIWPQKCQMLARGFSEAQTPL